jgi:hypothetical protein
MTTATLTASPFAAFYTTTEREVVGVTSMVRLAFFGAKRTTVAYVAFRNEIAVAAWNHRFEVPDSLLPLLETCPVVGLDSSRAITQHLENYPAGDRLFVPA